MLKKILLSALCIFAAVSVFAAPKIKIDQRSKEKVAETFLRAIASDDTDAMWLIIDPELREMAIKNDGGEKIAKKNFWIGFRQTVPHSENEKFRQLLNDPATKAETIRQIIQYNSRWFVYKSGKWYLNPMKQ